MANARIPPHDDAAEESVLGSVLIDKDAIVTAAELLKAEAFYKEVHRDIFTAMLDLFNKREPIDIVTVSSLLKTSEALSQAGGTEFLAGLANAVPTAAHVRQYSRIIRDLASKRNMIALSAELTDIAFDEDKKSDELMDLAQQKIFKLSESHTERAFIPIKEALAESFDRLDELQKQSGGLRGVPTGFADLDDCLSGMQKSNLIILAARPGVGKTAFSLNIAMQAAIQHRKKIAFFSLEMSKEELVDRLLVGQADIDAWRLKTGRLSEDDFTKLSDAMGVLADTEIYIDDTPGMSIMEIRTKSRRLMAEKGIDLIIVDYLQLLHGSGIYKDNRVQEVSEISQGLKNVARELKVPVLSLAQLSRAVENRGTKQPQLSDLRESGSIEQDADVVMFLYRDDEDARENVKLGIAKHRNGALRQIDLYFRGDRIRFYGVERKQKIGATV